MRYDLESMLPINAFSPRCGRGVFSRGMTLEGGKGGGGSAPSPDPNIGLAQQKMAEISDAYLKNWQTEVWPAMKEAAAKQEIRADEQFAIDKEIQEKQIAAADVTMAEYTRNAPSREAIYKEAETYNTEANKERIAAEAIGDIKTSFGVQAADLERRNQSYGISPTSGRSMATQNATGILQAATEASAATRARNAAEQLGWAKKMDAIALSQGQFGNQATSTGLALNAGAQALNAGQQSFANYGAMSGAMSQATSTANQGWNSVGTLGVQKYNADVNAYEAQTKADSAGSAGFGSLVGSLGAAAISKYSDIRMKHNIKLVGKTPAGTNIYSYEYKPEFKDIAGYGEQIGVMAHEVPHAAFMTDNGYLMVDYSKVI